MWSFLGFAPLSEHQKLREEVNHLMQLNENITQESAGYFRQLNELTEISQRFSPEETENFALRHNQLLDIRKMLERYLNKSYVKITHVPSNHVQCLSFVEHALRHYVRGDNQPEKSHNTYDWQKLRSVDMRLGHNGSFEVGYCLLEVESIPPTMHHVDKAWHLKIYYVTGKNHAGKKLVLEAEILDFKHPEARFHQPATSQAG